MFNTVSVQFRGQCEVEYTSKEYSYLTNISDLEVGDIVVVDTQYGLQIARVSSLFGDESKANKWIVCLVDTKAFEARLASLRRQQFIYKQMQQRMQRVNMIDQFASIAKSDPAMEKLLQEFNAIDSKGFIEK